MLLRNHYKGDGLSEDFSLYVRSFYCATDPMSLLYIRPNLHLLPSHISRSSEIGNILFLNLNEAIYYLIL